MDTIQSIAVPISSEILFILFQTGLVLSFLTTFLRPLLLYSVIEFLPKGNPMNHFFLDTKSNEANGRQL